MKSDHPWRLAAALPGFTASCLALLAGGTAAAAQATPATAIILQPGETPAIALSHARAGLRWDRIHPAAASAGSKASLANPVITGGTVVPATMTVGDQFSLPTVQFSYRTSLPLAYVLFDFASPNGVQTFTMLYDNAKLEKTGTVTFQSPTGFPPYTQPGQWALTNVEIIDVLGNRTVYSGVQIARIFTAAAISVSNSGTVDATPPTLLSGKLLTPTVSVSSAAPYFKASIQAEDAGSGYYAAYVFIAPAGDNVASANPTPLPLPLKRGTDLNYSNLQYSPPGNWIIAGYAVCDAAQNCVESLSAQDVQALFGQNSFTVTP